MHSRGALIVIEGIDRSGKSSQCQRLVQALKLSGHKVKGLKFPDRTTEIGKMINSYLRNTQEIDDHAVHLLFSANRWEQSADMVTSLKNGETLVIDRYAYSGAAFTGAKKNFTLEWCKHSDRGLPEPDLVLFLNLEVTDAEKRGGFGEERYEEKHFQERVHENFMKLKSKQWQMINADQSFENVHNTLLSSAEKIISEVGYRSIGKLWAEE